MPLSPVDLYRDVLPKTNCGECGFKTCIAFASMVVANQASLDKCPYLSAEIIADCNAKLAEQYAQGKWVKRDMAKDALEWAKKRAASMDIRDLPERIGGRLIEKDGTDILELPYLNRTVWVTKERVMNEDGSDLGHYETVFLLIHLAQGGSKEPTGKWKGLVEFPNTVSKMKSMKSNVEAPVIETFTGNIAQLRAAAIRIGGKDVTEETASADAAFYFQVLPRVPVMLMFWDAEPDDDFEAEARLLFDETILEHLDIESVLFLSECLRELLCEADGTS